MFFAGGSGSKADRIDTCLGDGTYNLSENGEIVFLNAVNYMLPPASAPVAHWTMDDGMGTLVTDSAGSNDGTIIGDVSWIDGVLGGAVSFVPDSYIIVDHAEELDFNDVDFSISMMIRYNAAPTTTEHTFIVKGTTGSDSNPGTGSRYTLFHKGTAMRFEIDNGPANAKSGLSVGDASFITNEWVQLTVVRDSANDQLLMYADGVLQGTQADTSGAIASGEIMTIGNSTNFANACEADIDDVRIYPVALTEDEIIAIY